MQYTIIQGYPSGISSKDKPFLFLSYLRNSLKRLPFLSQYLSMPSTSIFCINTPSLLLNKFQCIVNTKESKYQKAKTAKILVRHLPLSPPYPLRSQNLYHQILLVNICDSDPYSSRAREKGKPLDTVSQNCQRSIFVFVFLSVFEVIRFILVLTGRIFTTEYSNEENCEYYRARRTTDTFSDFQRLPVIFSDYQRFLAITSDFQ